MKITDGLLTLSWMVMLGLGSVLELSAQEGPPLPPVPPAPKRIHPAFRPVPLRGALATNTLAAAAVPALPVPQLYPVPAPAALPAVTPPPAVVTNPGALVFDAEKKDYSAKLGEGAANLTFNLTNISSSEVLVNRVTTSCGCTVAKLPEQPWHLAAGTNGPISVTVDLRGKSGTIVKSITVDSSAGMKTLMVQVTIPPPQLIAAVSTNNIDRTRNIELARADRQAVFKSDCAECHVKPAIGKLGKDLYAGACGICHEAEHRATMVPDLHVFKHPDTRDYWNQIIADGKLNSLMPAFSFKSGGILNEQQISSLVDYLMSDYVKDTNAAPHASIAPLPVSASPQAKASTARGSALGPFPVK